MEGREGLGRRKGLYGRGLLCRGDWLGRDCGDLKKVSLGKGFFASKTNTPNYYRGIRPNIKIRSKTTKTGFFVGYSVYPAITVY